MPRSESCGTLQAVAPLGVRSKFLHTYGPELSHPYPSLLKLRKPQLKAIRYSEVFKAKKCGKFYS